MTLRTPAILLFMSATALGCASKTGTGALVGGGAGALAGGAIGGGEGALIGGLLGAVVGGGIGMALEAEDRQRAAYVLESTPTDHTETWQNPDTGAYYEMTPQRTYRTQEGTPCREFTMVADIGGQPEQVYGTACRQADGSWKIIDSNPI